MEKAKTKKVLDIVLNTILVIFLIVCLLTVSITLFSSRDADGAANIFGHQLRLVTTSSMDKSELTDTSDFDIKSIPAGSLILLEKVPEDQSEMLEWYRDIKEGDVLTFRYLKGGGQVTITHRVIDIKEEGGGFKIDLQGDNKSSENGVEVQHIDTTIENNFNYVIGKVKGQSVLIGNIVAGLKTPLGVVLMVILPCVIIIAMEAYKIWKTLQEDKKQKTAAVMDGKNREIEELKLQLEQMKASLANQESKAAEVKAEDAPEATQPPDGDEAVAVEEVATEEVAEAEATEAEADEAVEEASEEVAEENAVDVSDQVIEAPTNEEPEAPSNDEPIDAPTIESEIERTEEKEGAE